MDERARVYAQLVTLIRRMGYPDSFGRAIADGLGSEKMMTRMMGYLRSAKPQSAEEIADEMLAILDDRDRWIKKKSMEYYNAKYNEMLYTGLGVEEDSGEPD